MDLVGFVHKDHESGWTGGGLCGVEKLQRSSPCSRRWIFKLHILDRPVERSGADFAAKLLV